MSHRRNELVRKRREAYTASRSLHNSWIVAALVEAVECKDPDTAAHMRAVAEIARLIGLEMKLPAQETDVLLVGALLHDVGKIAVPDIVLKKPVTLTPEEHALVRLHPITGANILKRIRVLWPIIPAVKHHHERFDGEGYPEGLSREEIPQAARVIQAADTLDVMTRDRSYQQGVTWEEALEEIACKAGTQFDPEVVEALLRVEEIAYQRPEPSETRTPALCDLPSISDDWRRDGVHRDGDGGELRVRGGHPRRVSPTPV